LPFNNYTDIVKRQLFFNPEDYDIAVKQSYEAAYIPFYTEFDSLRDKWFGEMKKLLEAKTTSSEIIGAYESLFQTEIDNFLNK
jgi:hypothetical protein